MNNVFEYNGLKIVLITLCKIRYKIGISCSILNLVNSMGFCSDIVLGPTCSQI